MRRPESRRAAWFAVTTTVALALALSACSSPAPVMTASSGTPGGTACSSSPEQLHEIGQQASSRLSAQIAASYTDQFKDLRAVLVSVCGHPALERYEHATAQDHRDSFSITKSVIGTLVGIALADGSLRSLDQPLSELLPRHRASMSAPVAALTLRQLLTMSAGLDPDEGDLSSAPWFASTDWVRSILHDGIRSPVNEFAYSTATSHVLAAVLVQATGKPVLSYAREKLFDPIGIPTRPAQEPIVDLAKDPATNGFAWSLDHQGVSFGGATLRLRPSDLLLLGQLYLDGGRLGGRQVVPRQWVTDSTAAQLTTPGDPSAFGYGYQWWVVHAGADTAFAARGYGGQLIEVVPSRHLVVVFSTDLPSDGVPPRVDALTYESIVARDIAPLVRADQP